MTIVVKTTSVADGLGLSMTCSVSGMPLTHATEDGMFCGAKKCVCKETSTGSAEALKELMVEVDNLWRSHK